MRLVVSQGFVFLLQTTTYNPYGTHLFWRIGMDWTSIITTVLSVIFGGLISAYFSWQGTKELRREAGNLQLLTKKLMLMMDDAGLIEAEWDEVGNPIRVVKLSGVSQGSSSATAELTVGHKEQSDKPPTG